MCTVLLSTGVKNAVKIYHITYCRKIRKKIMQTVPKDIKTKGNKRQ